MEKLAIDEFNSDGTMDIIIVAGDAKKEPAEELSDCKVQIDICKDELEEFLNSGNTIDIIKCLKENFEKEIVPDLDEQCEKALASYRYWGLKVNDSLIYPIPIPSSFRKSVSIIEKILKKEVKLDELSCDEIKNIVNSLIDVIHAQEYTLQLYKTQLNSLKKNVEKLTNELTKCNDELINVRSKCNDPNTKILDMIGQTAQTVLSKMVDVKKEEASALAKKAEIEAELFKAKLARELMEQEPGLDFEKALEMVEKMTDTFIPKILSVLEKINRKQ